MAKNYLEIAGICIRDIVAVEAPRVNIEGINGMVTGIAHGSGLEPYFRVRVCLSTGLGTQSPWFKLKEITRLGDSLYGI